MLKKPSGREADKGSQIYIEGQLRTRNWQDQSGQHRSTTEVVVNVGDTMQMLGGKQDGPSYGNSQPKNNAQQNQRSLPQQQNEPPIDFDEYIPF